VRHLAANPELQAALRADPGRIPDATEELLRRYTFTIPVRRVAKDAELGGWTLKENESLALYLPAADLDPREFEAPERFDMARKKAHIAFGAGVHRCLGSHLARLELQVLYGRLLERLPPFRLDPERPARFHAGNIIAVDSLPLRWD
jgi:cytochrome P450